MQDEARIAYVRLREFDVEETPETVWTWLDNNAQLVPDVARDRVTWNYDHMDSPWHLAFTTGIRPIKVEIDGETVIENGLPTRVDLDEVRTKASEQSRRLHERLQA
jgi:hypothetical protein